jgi:hypothetical protein
VEVDAAIADARSGMLEVAKGVVVVEADTDVGQDVEGGVVNLLDLALAEELEWLGVEGELERPVVCGGKGVGLLATCASGGHGWIVA